MLAECFEVLGGVPRVVLADRMGCLKAGVVANVVVPTPDYVWLATHYHGRLAVTDDGEGCLVRVEIHTESGHDGIEDGIEETIDAIAAALS